jgi:hypothetical protein
MEARMSAETVQSSGSVLRSARTLIGSIWRWLAGFRAPVTVASPVITTSYEPSANTRIEETAAVANPKTEAPPQEQTKSAVLNALDEGEVQRRRNLVRMFFNDFWSGTYEKPTGFLQRLDQAEDYVNDRLATNGEAWRLDSETRAMLGLPPRVPPH